MKKTIVISALLLNFSMFLSGQEVKPGGKVDVGMPAVLKGTSEGTYKLSDIERELNPTNKWGQNKKKSNIYWRVWSDRDNNAVYIDADKTTIAKRKLNFSEPVIIAFIKNDMALVYNDDLPDSKWPDISAHPTPIGWVPMDNLLLWDRCPTDDNYIQKKALIAIHLNDLKNKVENYRYTSPDPDEESGMQALTMDMNFYFIMKKVGRRALLCIHPSVERVGNDLLGWVDEGFYVNWDQRTCLEANWDPDYVEHWKNKEVCVYRDPNFSSGGRLPYKYGRENGDKITAYKYRWDPNFLRFPILDPIKDEDGWAHCTAFADGVTGKIGEFDGKAAEEVNEVRKEKRQMNIIYVIEASNDMGEYFDAVKASLDKLENLSVKNLKVKTGLVLYRCETEGNSAIEKAKLDEPDDSRFLSLLDASKANGKFTGSSRNVALKQAIETAINPTIMGFSEKQSTMLVIVGNRGDDQDLADDAILKELKRSHIQVMSIQVVNGENGSPAMYEGQVKEMIISNMKNQFGSIGAGEVSRKDIGDGYRLSSSKKDESVFFSCALYPPNINEKYTGADVTKWINNGVRWFSETIDRWSNRFEKDISETGNSGSYSKFLEEFLGTDIYKRIKKIGGIHAYDGYVPMKDSEGGNYWHYIIYMSRDEFRQLLDHLKETYNAAKEGSDERNKYQDAVRGLVKTMAGQIDDKQIDKMSTNDLQNLIYGLNVSSGLAKRTLNDITDQRKVSRNEYLGIMKKFAKKYEGLQDIYNNDYRYKAEMGGNLGEFKNKNTYYWIPIEALPFNDD